MLESKEERKYRRLRKLGQELHIPIPEAFWTLEVFDQDGKLIQKHHQRSHSWVRNAYNMMFTNLGNKDADDDTFGAGKLSFMQTSGAISYGAAPGWLGGVAAMGPRSVDAVGSGYLAAAGADDWGIQIGSGTNTGSFEDYILQTRIDHGTGLGQMSYIASSPHSTTYTADTKVLKNEITRYFNNNSGSSIDVNEVAITTRTHWRTNDNTIYWLMCRPPPDNRGRS